MMKKYKIVQLISFVLLFISMFSPNYMQEQLNAESLTSAKSMVVIEQSSHRVLFEKNAHQKLANASTTKIVTFLTVLKNCQNFNQKVKVDDRAIGIPGTSIYLKKGECLTVLELLNGMMLVSGNDAATALALFISPTVDEFAKLMTKESIGLGAKDSSFKNPHGLDEDGHYTTAYDLALITAECYKYPIFEEIVTTKNTKISGSSSGEFRFLKNKNKLLNTLDGCNGVKTGFTNDAGRCLVSSAKRDGLYAICVVLNCGPMFEDSFSLLNKSFNEYKMYEVLPQYSYIQDITVKNSIENEVQVKTFTQKGFSYPLTILEQARIKTVINIFPNISAPLEKESVVGNLQIYLDNHLLFSEKIYTMEVVKSNKVGSRLKDIISKW